RDTTLDNIDKRAFKRDTSDDQTFEEWLKEIESKREKFELLQVVDKRNPVDRKSLEEIHQIYDQHIALLEESERLDENPDIQLTKEQQEIQKEMKEVRFRQDRREQIV